MEVSVKRESTVVNKRDHSTLSLFSNWSWCLWGPIVRNRNTCIRPQVKLLLASTCHRLEFNKQYWQLLIMSCLCTCRIKAPRYKAVNPDGGLQRLKISKNVCLASFLEYFIYILFYLLCANRSFDSSVQKQNQVGSYAVFSLDKAINKVANRSAGIWQFMWFL